MKDEIHLDQENARQHPAENQAMIRASLQELGPGRSILIDGDGRVLAGNETYRQAAALGLPVRIVDAEPGELIAVRRADLEGRRAVRMGLLDNRASDLSHFDPEALLSLANKYGEETVTQGILDPGAWAEIIQETQPAEPEKTKKTRSAGDRGSAALIGIKRQRWSFRHGVGFLAVRSFQVPSKKTEIETLKGWKAAGDKNAAALIAEEVADMLVNTFRTFNSGWAVAHAPVNRSGFAQIVSGLLAARLGIETVDIFRQKKQAARRVLGERPEIHAEPTPFKNLVWFDDTLTTGRTLAACLDHFKKETGGTFVLPVVWIYDDAEPDQANL